MAADWNVPDSRQRKVMERRANVTERKRFIGGTWVTSDEYKRNVAIDDGGGGGGGGGELPAPPAGYEVWESAVGPAEWDFRDMGTSLPAGWRAQTTGPANAGASYRAQNVAVVPGVGLVHTAERAYVGAPAYSGKVFAEINVPQFCHVRFKAYVTNLKRGVWPSFWARPQTSGREGEKDYLEIFGGHIDNQAQYPRVFGANWISTPYGPVSQNTLGFDSTIGKGPNNGWVPAWEEPHVYDSQHTAPSGSQVGRVRFWIDDRLVPGQISASTSSTQTGVTQWPVQFESNTTWYLRTDLQISGNQAMTGGARNAGDDHAGPLSADQVGKFAFWTIEYVQIFVPA